MMPWIIITGICLFLDIFCIIFSIIFNPTIVNIVGCTGGWILSLYFFLVVCAFKAEMEKESPSQHVLPSASSAPPTGLIDLETLKRKMKNGSDNINYQQFN